MERTLLRVCTRLRMARLPTSANLGSRNAWEPIYSLHFVFVSISRHTQIRQPSMRRCATMKQHLSWCRRTRLTGMLTGDTSGDCQRLSLLCPLRQKIQQESVFPTNMWESHFHGIGYRKWWLQISNLKRLTGQWGFHHKVVKSPDGYRGGQRKVQRTGKEISPHPDRCDSIDTLVRECSL